MPTRFAHGLLVLRSFTFTGSVYTATHIHTRYTHAHGCLLLIQVGCYLCTLRTRLRILHRVWFTVGYSWFTHVVLTHWFVHCSLAICGSARLRALHATHAPHVTHRSRVTLRFTVTVPVLPHRLRLHPTVTHGCKPLHTVAHALHAAYRGCTLSPRLLVLPYTRSHGSYLCGCVPTVRLPTPPFPVTTTYRVLALLVYLVLYCCPLRLFRFTVLYVTHAFSAAVQLLRLPRVVTCYLRLPAYTLLLLFYGHTHCTHVCHAHTVYCRVYARLLRHHGCRLRSRLPLVLPVGLPRLLCRTVAYLRRHRLRSRLFAAFAYTYACLVGLRRLLRVYRHLSARGARCHLSCGYAHATGSAYLRLPWFVLFYRLRLHRCARSRDTRARTTHATLDYGSFFTCGCCRTTVPLRG